MKYIIITNKFDPNRSYTMVYAKVGVAYNRAYYSLEVRFPRLYKYLTKVTNFMIWVREIQYEFLIKYAINENALFY